MFNEIARNIGGKYLLAKLVAIVIVIPLLSMGALSVSSTIVPIIIGTSFVTAIMWELLQWHRNKSNPW